MGGELSEDAGKLRKLARYLDWLDNEDGVSGREVQEDLIRISYRLETMEAALKVSWELNQLTHEKVKASFSDEVPDALVREAVNHVCDKYAKSLREGAVGLAKTYVRDRMHRELE